MTWEEFQHLSVTQKDKFWQDKLAYIYLNIYKERLSWIELEMKKLASGFDVRRNDAKSELTRFVRVDQVYDLFRSHYPNYTIELTDLDLFEYEQGKK